MINDFIYYDIPVRIYFGRDQLKHLGAELKKYGTRVLMTYGGRRLHQENWPLRPRGKRNQV